MPPTGTEIEARPFGTDPETGTGATPDPTLRGTEAGAFDLILPPVQKDNNKNSESEQIPEHVKKLMEQRNKPDTNP